MSEGRGIPRFFVSFIKKRKGGFYFGSFSKRTIGVFKKSKFNKLSIILIV